MEYAFRTLLLCILGGAIAFVPGVALGNAGAFTVAGVLAVGFACVVHAIGGQK